MHSRIKRFSYRLPQWFRASALVAALSLTGKGLGLLRELETARLFGISASVDSFVAAFTLISFFARLASNTLMVGAPRLIVSIRGRSDSHSYRASMFRAVLLLGVGLTVIALLVLPRLVPLIFSGLDESAQELTVRLVYWMLPLVAGWTLVGALGGALNAQHHYGGYQVAMIVSNVGMLAVLWGFASRSGIVALGCGWSVGIWLGCLLLVYLLRSQLHGLARWTGGRSQLQAIRTLMRGTGGLFLWFILNQMPQWFDRFFASQLAPGSLAALSYAQRLFQLPLELVSVVVISVWVAQVAEMPSNEVARRTFRLMGWLALVAFPIAVVLMAFARPIVTLVYARGVFDAQAIAVTTGPFAMYALGFGFHTLSAVLVRTFQAQGVTRYPILAVVVDIVLTGVLDAWVISQGWGAAGIAGVNAVVAAMRVVVLGISLRCIQTSASCPCVG